MTPLRKGTELKAIRSHEPAGISGLVFEEVPDATPMIGDVLVKVAACGITHDELNWPLQTCRNGHPRDSAIPGQEVSGVVAALGLGTAGSPSSALLKPGGTLVSVVSWERASSPGVQVEGRRRHPRQDRPPALSGVLTHGHDMPEN